MDDQHLEEYKKIINLLTVSFVVNIVFVLCLNISLFKCYFIDLFGGFGFEFIKQFFYGCIGATVACVLFLAKDKEVNELESLKENPDPEILRLPDYIDRKFYGLRIATSGMLAVVGAIVILTGFTYLEVEYDKEFSLKQKLLFALTSFLIGLYQYQFLNRIEKVFNIIFKSDGDNKKKPTSDSK